MKGYGFGTFKGVFTPSILTILGVIMYLRFGWVLGNLGLFGTLAVVTLATSITFLTGLALASLATNMKIGGGGAYFIISRSLGLEAGAAVGLPLFFAQALGISFYVAGFSESIVALFPELSATVIGLMTLFILGAATFYSADIALKAQLFIMLAIALSLYSFFAGDASSIQVTPEAGQIIPKLSFWPVFAVFFPAVTGIEAGIAMSGDLKNPSKSLPLGTLGAVVVGYAVYLAIPIFLNSLEVDDQLLLSNSLIMRDVSKWGHLILIGLWGATLSSAIGAMLGAPRTLQALAQDGVVFKFLAKGHGENSDPRNASIVAYIIATAGILLGDLNVIAPILSMFFLTSYGLLNISAGFEELLSSPSWRPTFRVPWKINFIGAFACFSVMLMLNAGATLIALAVSGAVYMIMSRRSLTTHWGDARYGILMLAVRYAINSLRNVPNEVRSWKPHLLVLTGSLQQRWHLVELANSISQGRSLMTVASVVPEKSFDGSRLRRSTEVIEEYLRKRNVSALVKVLRASDTYTGLRSLVRAYGLGPIEPNTILIGDSEELEAQDDYINLLELICNKKKNLIVLRESEEEGVELWTGTRIDVWWARKSNNAGLMLALADQLRRSDGWKDAELVLKTLAVGEEVTAAVTEKDSNIENATIKRDSKRQSSDDPRKEGSGPISESSIAKKQLEEFIVRERISARVEVVSSSAESIFEAICESSKDASLVFIGMRGPQDNDSSDGKKDNVDGSDFQSYYQQLMKVTSSLPPTAIVYAAEDVPFVKLFSSN